MGDGMRLGEVQYACIHNVCKTYACLQPNNIDDFSSAWPVLVAAYGR